jgi:nitroreductase
MDLKTAIKKRKSVKIFSPKKPDWRKIIRAIDAGRHAPFAGNQNTIRFILVSDKKKILELAKASQQRFVGDADYIVAVVTDDSQLMKLYKERAPRYAAQQSGAAIQNFLLALTELGLSTTWVGFFDNDNVKETLEVPEKLTVEAIFPIGIEGKTSHVEQKRKLELENMIYFDVYKNKNMTPDTRVRIASV